MKAQTFVIKSFSDVQRVYAYLGQHHGAAAGDGKPLVVSISPECKKRSVAQNSLYWKWLSVIERKTGNDKDQMHFEFKKKFLINILKRDDKEYAEMCLALSALKKIESEQFRAIADGVIRETSTTRMDTKQFTEYLQQIEAYALAKMGISLPVPDDLKFALR